MSEGASWEWSIGIYTAGPGLRLAPHPEAENPVLTRQSVTDVDAAFVADPFLVRDGAGWLLFFEVKNRTRGRGEIGLAASADGLRWRYRGIVLAEEIHLSYPHVFDWEGRRYMVPETLDAGGVRLYEARASSGSSGGWRPVADLLAGSHADPTPFRYAGRWWMFSCTSPDDHDVLRLYHAEGLQGPWIEHRRSPIVEGDPRRARPAGRVLVQERRVIRFAQDCHPSYGTAARAFAVTELTPESYREEEIAASPVLSPAGSGWNAHGMHHVDLQERTAGGWIACVDGVRREGPA